MRRIKLLIALALFPALLLAQETASGPAGGDAIELDGGELPAVVVSGSKTRVKYLVRPGMELPKNMGIITTSVSGEFPLGWELGSFAKATKPFQVKSIRFSIRSNHIPGCVASINIYRVDAEDESFVNVLHRPICFEIGISDEPRHFNIQPSEAILLEPGRYFIAFQVVDYDKSIPQTPEMTMDFNIFMKNSYLRDKASGKMEHYPVNIGIAVNGTSIP